MILVTGSTGFLGRDLVPRLLEEGYDVRLLSRNVESAKNIFPKAEVVEGDITDKKGLEAAIEGIDEVVHLAGLVSYNRIEDVYRVNYEGSRNLVDSCGNVKRFIFYSSVSVMGPSNIALTEKSACNPGNDYGRSKLQAEDYLRASPIPSVSLRIAPVYGAGAPWFTRIMKILDKHPIVPKTDSKTQMVHVSDVSKAVLLSLKKERVDKDMYIISEKEPIKISELAEKIILLLGKSPKHVPLWAIKIMLILTGMKGSMNVLLQNRLYDTSKAGKELGFVPEARLDEELEKMVEWYLSHKAK